MIQPNNKTLMDGRQQRIRQLPVDRGWSWVVLFACFGVIFIMVGVLKSFGLFFIEFLRAYRITASTMAIGLSIQTACFTVTAFSVMTLGFRYFSTRQFVMTGGTLSGIGYLLNAFSPSVSFLYFSHGFLNGVGLAMVYGPTVVLLSAYFEKWKGLANSLANVGGSAGSLVIPMLIRFLLDTYGLWGALMIVAGIILNLVVMGSLMRPFPVSMKERAIYLAELKSKENEEKIDESELIENIEPENESKVSNGKMEQTPMLHGKLYTQVSVNSDHSYKTSTKSLHNSSQSIQKMFDKLANSAADLHGSICNLQSPVLYIDQHNSSTDSSVQESTSKNNCWGFFRSLVNLDVLMNHRFRLIMIAGFLIAFGSSLPITFIPPFAKDKGIPSDKVALLITITAVADFIGRFAIAMIADTGILRRQNLIGVCMVISGIAAMCNHFFRTFISFSIYCAIYGLFGGCYYTLFPVIIVEAIGQHNLSNGIAIISLVHGISLMTSSYIIGFLRDATNSYHASFYTIGGGVIIGAVFLFFDPIARKLEERRSTKIIPDQ